MFEGSQDFLFDHEGIEYHTYKLTWCDEILSVYQVIAEPTQNENQLLLTYKLIHTCNCTSEEWYGENPKFTADIEQIIYKDVRSIRWQDDLQLCGKWYEKQYGLYSAHVKYLHVEIYEDW